MFYNLEFCHGNAHPLVIIAFPWESLGYHNHTAFLLFGNAPCAALL